MMRFKVLIKKTGIPSSLFFELSELLYEYKQ